MTSYRENYGSDIDNNRGRVQTFYELEEDDRECIVEMIKEEYPDGDYPLYMTITMYGHYEEEVEFEIAVEDWL